MAYNPQGLSVLAYANGFTMWHYKTDDYSTSVRAPNYFRGTQGDMLRPGDLVIVNARESNCQAFVSKDRISLDG